MRLVGPNGEQVGIVRVEDALRLAAEADLDLVEVAPMARPPVAKLMDFGKYKYEAALKAREARKNQVNTVIKEIKLRPKIDPHDYGTKKGHVERFLKAGDKVKVTIMFRGREQSRPELGFRLLQRLAEDIVELGYVESSPKQDGRNMVMVLGPTKKKADARAEQRRRRESGSVAVAHDEPMDLGDLTHLATEIQEPEVADVLEVEEIQEPEVAQATEVAQVTEVADAPEPAANAPAPTATAPAPRTPTPAPSTPTPAPSAPAKATPAKAASPKPAASTPRAAPAAPATPAPAAAAPATPTPRPTPRPAPRPAPPAKTTTSAESA
ncbi:MAG TPA: translation initiation factor IF-3 [Lapillicoccus sp.]|uniref:translation initiation factor IF-3 n=1 Tax=Lapillicoccus sp. TaxID=1909287 RepID=UPI002F92A191